MPFTGKKVTLYKYLSVNHLKETINDSRLYMDNGSHFNDPFELMTINTDTGESLRIEGMHLLCLTNSRSMKLMWSHYTDSHKGVCLTVEVPYSIVYAVCYTGQRVKTNDNLDAIIAHSLKGKKKGFIDKDYAKLSYKQKIAMIKDQKWSYEKEYRIALEDTENLECDDKGNYYLPVKIKNIYFGVNFDFTSNADIIDTCLQKGIKLTRMELSNNDYSLKPVKWG